LTDEIDEFDRRHEELADRPRPWRERRCGPDPDLLLVEAKQAELIERRSEIEHALDTARSTTHARQALLADHDTDIRRVDQIPTWSLTGAIAPSDGRINDPPGYSNRALGPP
jgi:hypothetical protein